MTSRAHTALPQELEDAIRATPGVTTLYPAGPLFTTILTSGAQILGARDNASPVFIDGDDEGVQITVSIGVHRSIRATDVARAVTESMTVVASAWGISNPTIHLTVAHIAENPPARA